MENSERESKGRDVTPLNAVHAAEKVVTSKRRARRPTDQRALPVVSLGIALVYASCMYFSIDKFGGFDKPKGLRFHSDVEWMQAFVRDEAVFGLPIAYVVAVMIVSRISTFFPKITFTKTIVQPIYNIFQIVVCSYMVWGLWPYVDWKSGNPFGLNTQPNAKIEWFVFVHYLTKYLDWCDTFFMILNKNYRQLSYLQVFHHATIGMIWGALLQLGWGNGTAFYGAFINSVTHVIMYTHYLWTSFGLKNPLKRYLTMFQLSQFMSCVVHALLVAFSGAEKVFPADGLPYIQIMYHPIMLYLFTFKMRWAPRWISGIDVNVAAPAGKGTKQA